MGSYPYSHITLYRGGFARSRENKNDIFPLPHYLWSPNMAEWWYTMSYFHSKRYITVELGGFVKSHGKLIFFISTCTRSMATKNGNVVTYSQRFLPVYSHDFLSMCPCQVAWQIKNIISPRSQWLWSPNLSEW